jgi:hypothetical protein
MFQIFKRKVKSGFEATFHFHNYFALKLQVSVACAEHRREAGRFHFTAATFARLLEVAMISHFLENAFAVDLLFQTAERLIDGFALFQSNLGQKNSLPLWSFMPSLHGRAFREGSG